MSLSEEAYRVWFKYDRKPAVEIAKVTEEHNHVRFKKEKGFCGCGQKEFVKGFCYKHYYRNWRRIRSIKPKSKKGIGD